MFIYHYHATSEAVGGIKSSDGIVERGSKVTSYKDYSDMKTDIAKTMNASREQVVITQLSLLHEV